MGPIARTHGNLCTAGVARRLRFGLFGVAFGLVLAVVLAKLGVPWAWRLLLIVPFYLAATGFVQGLSGT